MFAVTPRMLWSSMGPPLVASAALAAVLYGINRAFAAPVLTIVVGGLAGAVVYFGLLQLIAADLLKRLRAMAFPRSA
jgi:zinc transporter ZupT